MEVLQAQICPMDSFKPTEEPEVSFNLCFAHTKHGDVHKVKFSKSVEFWSCRTLRQVKDRSQDKSIQDDEVFASLACLFTELFRNDLQNQGEVLRLLHARSQIYSSDEHEQCRDSRAVMMKTLGFSVERKRSSLQGAGTGVFVTGGHVRKGNIVAMYPGNDCK